MKLALTCIGIIISIFNSISQELIVRANSGNVVPCKILITDNENHVTEIKTNQYGEYIFENIDCKTIKSIIISAFSSLYKNPYPISCTQIGEIIIPTINEFSNLTKNSLLFFKEKTQYNLGVSLLATNELAAIARNSQLFDSDSVEKIALELTASFFELNIDKAIYQDPLQNNKAVASQELIDLIVDYQKANFIDETGMIDIKTISSMVDLKPGNVIFNEFNKINEQ